MSRSDQAAEDSGDVDACSARQAVSAGAIGTLQTVTGLVTLKREGIQVAHPAVGDCVYEGDQIETGADGLVIIAFVDGTTFHLYADACVVVDEFNCGAAKSSNSALLRVLKGMFGFIAGKVATSGRLLIDTPLGQIRSTAPAAGIGSLTFSVLTVFLVRELKAESADVSFLDDGKIDYKDLKHGVFEIVTKGDHPQVIIVDDPSQTIVLRPRGSGVSVQAIANTPEQMAQLARAYEATYSTCAQGQQDPLIQKWQRADANPNATGSASSSGLLQQASIVVQQISENGAAVVTSTSSTTTTSGTGTTGSPTSKNPPTPTATWQYPVSGNWDNPLLWSDAWAPYAWQNIVINGNITVTVDTTTGDSGPSATAATNLTVGAGATLDIVGGGSLVVSNALDVGGTVEVIDPSQATLTVNGPVTVEVGGLIKAVGSNAAIYFSDSSALAPGTYTVDNSGTILAEDGATVWFEQGALKNEVTGIIEADAGGIVVFETGNAIVNAGLLEAIAGGEFDVKDSEIDNTGTNPLAASGATGILISGSSSELLVDVPALKLDGAGAVASAGNELENFDNTIFGFGTISNLQLVNDVAGVIDATGGTLTLATGAVIDNAGLLEATGHGELDVKDSTIDNTGSSAAGTGIVIDGTSTLLVDVGGLTLEGGGTVTLEGTVTGAAANAGNELENLDNAITATGTAATISNLHFVNAATVEVSSGTLTLGDDGVDNFLTSGATTTYGTITVDGSGTLDLTGGVTIADGVLNNLGKVNVSGTGNEITDENGSNGPGGSGGTNIFTNTGTLQVLGNGVLTLNNDLVTNTGGTLTVDATGMLNLTGTDTINGGAVNDYGQITVNGTVSIENEDGTAAGGTNFFTITGDLEVASGMLTLLDDRISGVSGMGVSGSTITVDSGATLIIDDTNIFGVTLNVDTGGVVEVLGTSTINTFEGVLYGQTTIESGQVLNLLDELVLGNITVDGPSGLLSAGALNLQGGNVIENGALTNAGVINVTGSNEIESDDGTGSGGTNVFTNSGTTEIFASATLTLLDDLVTNTAGVLTVDGAGTLDLTGGDTVNNGQFNNKAGGTINVSGLGNEIENETGGTTIGSGTNSLTNAGLIDVTGTLMLSDDLVTNTGCVLTVEGTGTLDLTGGDTINNGQFNNKAGGTINVSGLVNEIENETGGTTIGSGTNSLTNAGLIVVTGTLSMSDDLA